MYFVLGLFLITVGLVLSLTTNTVPLTQNILGFEVKVGEKTVYPYLVPGLCVIVTGSVFLVMNLDKKKDAQTENSTTTSKINVPLSDTQYPISMTLSSDYTQSNREKDE